MRRIGENLGLLAVGLACGFLGGVAFRSNEAHLEEAKRLRAVLVMQQRFEEKDIMHQFLLARYYFALGKLKANYRTGLVIDFGPVDMNVMTGVPVDKEEVDLEAIYSKVTK